MASLQDKNGVEEPLYREVLSGHRTTADDSNRVQQAVLFMNALSKLTGRGAFAWSQPPTYPGRSLNI